GMLANLVVCRMNLAGNPSFDEVLQNTTKVLAAVEPYRDYPFFEVADYLSKQQGIIPSSPVQVAFSWEIDPCNTIAQFDESLSIEPYPLG
ncbi:hypothetical protein, partial [Burkholderia sp. SIMBA_024]|uniref:hypothetical protein n=1 Tax=Burkholderia sp. SIMBA_024 TaxID=3085768 RepID=UPI00397D911F